MLPTTVTVLDIRSSDLIHLKVESLYPFTNLFLFLPNLQLLTTFSTLCFSASMSLTFSFLKTSSPGLENEKLSGGALELSQFAQSWDRKWGGKMEELGGAGAAGSSPWKLQIPSSSALGTLDKQPYRPPTLLQ